MRDISVKVITTYFYISMAVMGLGAVFGVILNSVVLLELAMIGIGMAFLFCIFMVSVGLYLCLKDWIKI